MGAQPVPGDIADLSQVRFKLFGFYLTGARQLLLITVVIHANNKQTFHNASEVLEQLTKCVDVECSETPIPAIYINW